MRITVRQALLFFSWILMLIAVMVVSMVDWRIGVGLIIFAWGHDLENYTRKDNQ